MSWRGEDGGIQSANMGHDVIMTPGSGGLYIDHYQGDPKIEPVAIGGYAPLEKTYSYNPIPEAIDPAKRHHIKGAQTNLWAEYLYTADIMQYRAFPREIALAEAVWTPLEKKNFKDFTRRLDNAYVRLDKHGANYHIPLPEQPLPGVAANAKPEERTASLTRLILHSRRPVLSASFIRPTDQSPRLSPRPTPAPCPSTRAK